MLSKNNINNHSNSLGIVDSEDDAAILIVIGEVLVVAVVYYKDHTSNMSLNTRKGQKKMKIKKEILETINYHIENKMIITIERKFNDNLDSIMGFPIAVSKNFLLMTVIYDFHDEGYTVLRLSDISDAYSKKSNNFYEQICIAEGLQDKIAPVFSEDISSIRNILKKLQNYDGYISIQCEEQIKKNTFYLGKIIDIKDCNLVFKDIGPDGKWDEELNTILFDDITQLSFDDYYSKMFYKYVVD